MKLVVCVVQLIALGLLVGCGGAPKTAIAPSPSIESSPSTRSDSNIGKKDQTGTEVTVDVPGGEPCQRKEVSVKLDTYEQCLVEGLTWVQVVNLIGYRGTEQSSSGSTKIVQWNNGNNGYITAVFVDNRLKSKSQVGLR